jgi:hypothetical protein
MASARTRPLGLSLDEGLVPDLVLRLVGPDNHDTDVPVGVR